MLLRSEPFREFDRLTEAMLSERRARPIPVDAYRRGNEFTVLFDLPGVDARFIELTVEKDLLSVRATRGWVRGRGRSDPDRGTVPGRVQPPVVPRRGPRS